MSDTEQHRKTASPGVNPPLALRIGFELDLDGIRL
jgi:hypothetical protein